jgi:flagellar biosynthesis anti-sigma factor FlgM
MAISNVKNPPSLSGAAAPPKAAGSDAAGSAAGSAAAKGAASAATAASATATSASSALKSATQGYAKVGATPLVKDAAAVSISPRAKEMSLARALVDETPDVREDKVAEFKKRIASGEYKPDAGRIADGILSEAMKDEISKKPDVALE